MKLDKQIRQTIGKNCANYINGKCLFAIDSDNRCTYERDYSYLGHRRCVYFEESILPEDKILEAKYWEEVTGDRKIRNDNIDNCERCGEEMIKSHGKQKYCDDCAKQVDKDKARERMRRKRQRDNTKQNW